MKARILWMLKLMRDVALIPLIRFIPRQKNKIVFGAWSGKQYGCNPKYLFEYMVKRGSFDCIWIGDKALRDQVLALSGAKFSARGSLAAFWHYITASFQVSNVNCYDDILWLPTCGRSTIVYTSHGYPDKKAENQFTGNGAQVAAGTKKGLRKFLHDGLVRLSKFMYPREAWSSASSPIGDKLRVEGQPSRLSKDRMLHAGTPRADYIVNNADNAELKEHLRAKYAKLLDLPIDKRWILFVPTWRHDPSYLFSFSTSQIRDRWQAFLEENNAVIVEKQHPKTVREGLIKGGKFGAITVVTQEQNREIDTQELLLASDLLITDYSSIYYDFYLMNRPCVHFVYDFDHAVNKDFGFDFDLRDYGGGPFVYAEDKLFDYLAMPLDDLLKLRNARTREHLSYEDGHCCEAYYNFFERMRR